MTSQIARTKWRQWMCTLQSKRLFRDFSGVIDGIFHGIVRNARITIKHVCFSALTFTGSLGRSLNIRPSGLMFKQIPRDPATSCSNSFLGTRQMLMHEKKNITIDQVLEFLSRCKVGYPNSIKSQVKMHLNHLRNKFHFSEVHGSMNATDHVQSKWRPKAFVLIVHLFVSYAHISLCHFFSSSWCRGLAAASACGSSWTFLLSIFFQEYGYPCLAFMETRWTH